MTLSSDCELTIGENNHGVLSNEKSTPPKKGGWNAAVFVILVEMVERFAYYGLATNLITYLTDELKQPTATAAKNVNIWAGITSILPLFGAFLVDSYVGRFNAILFASIIYCTGMVMLSISASFVPGHYRKVLFFISLYIVSSGEAGHRPCVLTFAADQFGEETAEEKKTKSSFYNWWNFAVVIGATFANFGIVYIQDNVGWGIGFGIVAASMSIALAIFVLGMKKYVRNGPTGSPLTSVARVFVAAMRKRNIDEKHHSFGVYDGNVTDKTLARTTQFRLLDKAMMIDSEDKSKSTTNPWRLCSQNQVEEVKLLLRLGPIWLCCLMFPVVNSQLQTFFTRQAATMSRSLGHEKSSSFQIPSASLQAAAGFTTLIFIPIYQHAFVPIARKVTKNPRGVTVLQRIGAGLFISALTMTSSALVESRRLGFATRYGLLDRPTATVPISVWWLVPQYALCGLSNAFAAIGLQELYYDQMPPGMRSLGAAANLGNAGVGNFIGAGIIAAVRGLSRGKWLDDNINRARLDCFYYLIAALSCLNLCAYMLCAERFIYKKFDQQQQEVV